MSSKLLGAVLLLLLSVCLHAQYTTGRVEGTVLDSSSAPIKDASVELTSLQTAIARRFDTTTEGLYSFASVPPGKYRLVVSAPNFESPSADVTVYIGQTSAQNFTLQIGQATSSVNVEADAAPLLNTSDPLRQVTRNALEIQTLPNLGRNIASLAVLAPGVTPTFNPRGGALTTVSGAQAGQLNANGGRSKASSTQLDYTDANDWEFGGIALGTQPTPDMLGEFQLLTNNWSAEYGVKSSSQIVMVTKSGTNTLHGTAYNFLQNSAFNARDYFDRTQSATPLRQNYYGFTVGGPLIRNRTFLFGGYEGRKTRGSGNTLIAFLPTQAARDRATSQDVRSLLQLLPQPTASTTDPLIGSTAVLAPSPSNNDQYLIRGDHYFSEKNNLTARYYSSSGDSISRTSNSLPQYDAGFNPVGKNAMLADSWTPTPNLTNELRLAYGRSSALFEPLTDPATPRFAINGLVGFGTVQSWPQGRIFNVYQLNDTLSWVRGRHIVKGGLDLRHIQDNSLNLSGSRGVFNFASVTNFLNGIPSTWTQLFGNTYRGFRQNFHGFFVQDDWKLTPTVTLNLGLRWEYQGGLSEANRLQSVLDTSQPGAIGQLGSGPLGTFRTQNPLVSSNPGLVAPRFGFAWNPGRRNMVIRGGYGIYYDSFIFNGLQAGRTTPPANYTGTLTTDSITGANSFANLLAGTSAAQRSLATQVGTFNNVSNLGTVTSTNPQLHNPYVQQFSFGLQQRFATSLVAEVAYVGTRGTRLTTYGPINSVLPSRRPAPASSAADQAARLPSFREAFNKSIGEGNTRIDSRFNDVNYITDDGSSTYHSLQISLSKSFSGGLLVRSAYTWSRSIDNSSDYSPGQNATDFNFTQNQFNLAAERGVSDFDLPHRFTLSHVWAIPVFREQKGIAGHMLGGWTFASVNQLQSGIPFTVVTGSIAGIPDANLDGNTVSGLDNSRPNCLAGGSFAMGRPTSNTRYAPILVGNNGNCGRNVARLNKLLNFDWTFSKSFRLFESGPLQSGPWNLEYRADLFNIFNNPYLSVTGSDYRNLSSPNFGIYNTAAASRRIQMALRLTW